MESTYDVGKYNKVAYLTADIGTKLGIPAYIVYYNIEGAEYPTFKITKINAILEEIDPISEGSLIELNEQEYIGYHPVFPYPHRNYLGVRNYVELLYILLNFCQTFLKSRISKSNCSYVRY